MSLILVDRSSARASSRLVLAKRVKYISDPDDPNHSGEKEKTIYPARNYNVAGGDQSAAAFIAHVIALDADYSRGRKGKPGKRSSRLFEELIYSSMSEAWLNAAEREEIERKIVRRFGSMAACRTAWHVDKNTGRCDLHVLLSAKNLDYPAQVTLWAEFGGDGGKHIYDVMDQIDGEIATHLNRSLSKLLHRSAKSWHKGKVAKLIGAQVPLAQELASRYLLKKKNPNEIDECSIVEALKGLGHKVVKVTARSISIVFRGREKPRRYNLADLTDRVVVALEREIQMLAPPRKATTPPRITCQNKLSAQSKTGIPATNSLHYSRVDGVVPPLFVEGFGQCLGVVGRDGGGDGGGLGR